MHEKSGEIEDTSFDPLHSIAKIKNEILNICRRLTTAYIFIIIVNTSLSFRNPQILTNLWNRYKTFIDFNGQIIKNSICQVYAIISFTHVQRCCLTRYHVFFGHIDGPLPVFRTNISPEQNPCGHERSVVIYRQPETYRTFCLR